MYEEKKKNFIININLIIKKITSNTGQFPDMLGGKLSPEFFMSKLSIKACLNT